METWDYPRSPAGIQVLANFAGRRGLSLSALLEGSRITRAQLQAPEMEIAAVQELRVLRNLVHALGDPVRLGIEVGMEFHFATFGIWGLAVVSSATGREAIRHTLRFLPLTYAFSDIGFEERSDDGVLSFAEPDLPEAVRDFAVARDMVTAALLLREAIGPDLTLQRVVIKAMPRGAGAAEPMIFGTRIEAAAAANQIVIAAPFLDRPLPQANPVTAAMAERLCRQQLQQQKRGLKTGALSSRYRAITAEDTPLSLRAFAQLTNVSERTLKRRLSAEGTSFRTLSADGRRAVAEALLADETLRIGEIAERLGFSDLSSFSQAFKRWTGLAPSAYRKRSRQASGNQPIG